MGILSKFFKKKYINIKDKDEVKVVKKYNIDSSQTTEKFLPFKDEIIDFLLSKLEKLNKLEQEIFERSQKLKSPKEPNQIQPGEKELWREYKERHKQITDSVCMKPSKNTTSSFGKPTKYEYITYPDTKIIFIMKSAKRAVIEMEYENGVKSKDQFILKKEGNDWKIFAKKYGYQGESTWYKDEL